MNSSPSTSPRSSVSCHLQYVYIHFWTSNQSLSESNVILFYLPFLLSLPQSFGVMRLLSVSSSLSYPKATWSCHRSIFLSVRNPRASSRRGIWWKKCFLFLILSLIPVLSQTIQFVVHPESFAGQNFLKPRLAFTTTTTTLHTSASL